MKIEFQINGHPIEIDENPKKKLSEFLRQNNYFSVKTGCNKGKCGSCTILFNETPMVSCLIPLAEVADAKITTLENFMKTEDYTDIEKAFKQKGINFCGYCNAGKILMAYNLIKNNPQIELKEINEQMSFFTCNCVDLESLSNSIFLAAAVRRKRLKDKKNAK
jgi:carbon-monoxide dehydrogenase small subunit